MSDYEDSNVFEDDGLDEYTGFEFPTPTPRRINADLHPGKSAHLIELRPRITPSAIKFTENDSVLSPMVEYDKGDIIFNSMVYYKVDQLDWLIQCLQQIKEMVK